MPLSSSGANDDLTDIAPQIADAIAADSIDEIIPAIAQAISVDNGPAALGDLISTAQVAFEITDETVGKIEHVSPNLMRKIAKTSAVIDDLADHLDPDSELPVPAVATREGLFKPDEVAESVTAALALTQDVAVSAGEDEVYQLTLESQVSQLVNFLDTAAQIHQGLQDGNVIIEGEKEFSHTGVLLLKQFEGLYLNGYILGDGMCTIGYGSAYPIETKPDCLDWEITEQEAEDMLAAELQSYATAVNEHFTRPLTQNQFDALTSFSYNVGAGIFKKYDWSRETSDERVATILPLYVNPPQFTEGLTIRRNAEVALFNS
ncbi:MAG: lysozyme [Cellulomonadaceae bacterium]|jgi:GH24 family phage-related lysozyme (muramidase)|nr:lysozyme [Cellulomonadaceae bacterium]